VNILFLCTDNSCRSLPALLLARLMQDRVALTAELERIGKIS